MLKETEKNTIRNVLAEIKATLPQYKSRRAQRELIAAVARVLAHARRKPKSAGTGSQFLVVEAGTGTGKSHALGSSSIVLGHFLKKKVVISSSTVALQEQLVSKDLPFLQGALPFPINIALAKGRKRYVCTAKLAVNQRIGERQGNLAHSHFSEDEYATLASMAEMLVSKKWSGDKDTLTIPINPSLWNSITNDRHGCAGTKCPSYEQCPFYAARKKVQQADVIVANHDLVLAALAMEPGSVLPDPAECLVVFDEAHTLPDKVSERFAARHALRGAAQWAKDIAAVAGRVFALDGVSKAEQPALGDELKLLSEALGSLHTTLASSDRWIETSTLRLPHGRVPESIEALGFNIRNHATRVLAILTGLREALFQNLNATGAANQTLLGELGIYLGRVETIVGTWDLMMTSSDPNNPPIAKWFERTKSGEIIVCATPISAAATLEKLLWSKAAAVVMASATLTACGEFKLFMESTGLSKYPDAEMMALDSPFDYGNQAQLIVPRMKYGPEQAEQHTAEVISRLPPFVGELGTLVLFTSDAQMKAVYAGIPEALRVDVLLQGHLSKGDILNRHRERIGAGQRSIIFGLASFGEGIDLPGEECETVIIAKLPFSQPTDPIQSAKAEWIEAQGRSAFNDMVLPEASVKLAQMVGRLIRRESDTGRVIILDKRLVTKRYGKSLLDGLPPFRLDLFGRTTPVVKETPPIQEESVRSEPSVFRSGRTRLPICIT